MSYRVQFTITDDEKNMLEQEAKMEGFPNLAELSKARALKGKTTYHTLYQEMIKKIEELPSGEHFHLRKIIPTPPILLGRWLFDGVKNGTIPNVDHVNNNDGDAEEYVKK